MRKSIGTFGSNSSDHLRDERIVSFPKRTEPQTFIDPFVRTSFDVPSVIWR